MFKEAFDFWKMVFNKVLVFCNMALGMFLDFLLNDNIRVVIFILFIIIAIVFQGFQIKVCIERTGYWNCVITSR